MFHRNDIRIEHASSSQTLGGELPASPHKGELPASLHTGDIDTQSSWAAIWYLLSLVLEPMRLNEKKYEGFKMRRSLAKGGFNVEGSDWSVGKERVAFVEHSPCAKGFLRPQLVTM